MSKDLLAEATRALRATEPTSELEARATRARILTGLHQTRVRRRTKFAFLVPIAASFVAVSAWGAASGQARSMLEKLENFVGVTVRAPETPKVTARKPSAASAPAVPNEESVAPTPMRDSDPPLSAATATAAPARATGSGGAASLRVEKLDPTLALYRTAHAAHFVEHDPARALTAWDAYLNAAPNGQFAPEARYNRALSLVRLGRNEEARQALEPFARGAYGNYRQAEASALLAHLQP